MFSKDGAFRTIHFECGRKISKSLCWISSACSEVSPSGTPVRRTCSGTWWTSTCTFVVIQRSCVRMAPMNVSSNVLRSFSNSGPKIWPKKGQPPHDETLRGIQPVDDPTVEPTPSKKHCKREVLNIVGLQLISRDTPFLRCQADRQSVLLGSDFE